MRCVMPGLAGLLWAGPAWAGEVGIRTDGPVDVFAEGCEVLSIAPVPHVERPADPLPAAPTACAPQPDETSYALELYDLLPAERDKAPPARLSPFYAEQRRRHGGLIVGGSVMMGL